MNKEKTWDEQLAELGYAESNQNNDIDYSEESTEVVSQTNDDPIIAAIDDIVKVPYKVWTNFESKLSEEVLKSKYPEPVYIYPQSDDTEFLPYDLFENPIVRSYDKDKVKFVFIDVVSALDIKEKNFYDTDPWGELNKVRSTDSFGYAHALLNLGAVDVAGANTVTIATMAGSIEDYDGLIVDPIMEATSVIIDYLSHGDKDSQSQIVIHFNLSRYYNPNDVYQFIAKMSKHIASYDSIKNFFFTAEKSYGKKITKKKKKDTDITSIGSYNFDEENDCDMFNLKPVKR